MTRVLEGCSNPPCGFCLEPTAQLVELSEHCTGLAERNIWRNDIAHIAPMTTHLLCAMISRQGAGWFTTHRRLVAENEGKSYHDSCVYLPTNLHQSSKNVTSGQENKKFAATGTASLSRGEGFHKKTETFIFIITLKPITAVYLWFFSLQFLPV